MEKQDFVTLEKPESLCYTERQLILKPFRKE